MPKEALAMSGAEGGEALGDRPLEFWEGAGGGLTQMRFEFGEGHFYGIEIGTVRRQVAHGGPAG